MSANDEQETTQMVNNEIMDIPLTDILMDENLNCRASIAPMDVQDLARDIQKRGLLSPVIVQIYGREYYGKKFKWRLIAGFRRFTSHKVIGAKTIKATICNVVDEKGARLLNLRENLMRKDLNIMEEAKAVEHLKAFSMTLQDIGTELGKSYSWVQVRAYLLQLPKEIQEQAAVGIITQHQIRDIKNLPTRELQIEAVQKIKSAREKGEKSPILRAKKSESSLARRRRNATEINAMMDHIQESVGNNFGTRCLAWCNGNITDNAVYQEIRAIANKAGRPYVLPVESVASMAGMDVSAERT